MTFRARLPLIPLSPMIQTSRNYAKELAQMKLFLSENNSQETVMLLVKEKEKLDRLNRNMQAIQSSFLADFNVDDIAKEIACINCSLFRMVTLDKTWLCNFDKRSNMIPLLDFHRYLSHSFAHQVIVSSSSENVTYGIVSQLIQLAYILLHVYRDFSGCTAILTSLQMPQVQRQKNKWNACPAKYITIYKELVMMLSPNNNYEAYHYQLRLHTARFLNVTPHKSQTIAIPFMQAHLFIIQNLVQTYSLSSSETETVVILSEVGQKALVSMLRLLQFCQHYLKIDPIELEKYPNPNTASTLQHRLSLQINKRSSVTKPNNSLKISIPTCLDLDLLRGNANVFHWLVSRAFLSRFQLNCESLYVEPKADGEVVSELDEEYDPYWNFFSYNNQGKPNKDMSMITRKDHTNHQAEVDKVCDSKAISKNTIQSPMITRDADAALDSILPEMQGQIVNSKVADRNKEDMTKEEGKSQRIHIESGISLTNEEKNKIKHTLIEQVIDTHQNISGPEQNNNDQRNVEIVHQGEMALGKNKATVSLSPIPAALEFHPRIESSNSTTFEIEQTESIDNETEEKDDDVIILNEDDEEEWTGYPIETMPLQTAETEEEEEWTGYPFSSQDEEEDDDEVWKGYPAPHEEQQLPRSEGKSVSLSSIHQEEPQTMSPIGDEQWKGHQKSIEAEEKRTPHKEESYSTWNSNSNNQLHAIGKAAARRLQYSFSNADGNRKGLPSQFVPSTST